MADEKAKTAASADRRKKIMIVAIILLFAFLAWQVYGMFGGGSDTPPPVTTNPKLAAKLAQAKQDNSAASSQTQNAASPGAPNMAPTSQSMASQTQVAKQLPMSDREVELLKLQQETESKYIAATNQLQMLKLTLEIAETNKNIMAAKLDTLTKEKGIVDLLTPPKKPTVEVNYNEQMGNTGQPPVVAQTPAKSVTATNIPAPPQVPAPPEEEPVVPYTVLSVSKIQERWSAVVGVQGALYSIHVGDVVPVDGSKVVGITSGGIMLQKNGKERKISLVPII
jgi:hypothetical protein